MARIDHGAAGWSAERASALGWFSDSGCFQILLQKLHVIFRDVVRNLVGVRALAESNQVRDAVNEHGRLAASRAGQQQKRPFGRQNRLLLHIVERGKAPCNYRPPRL